MDDGSSSGIMTIRLETLNGETFHLSDMPEPVAILTFLRYVG